MKSKIFLITMLLTLSGCATIIRGTKEQVSINTSPVGAKVELSSGQTCITPCNIEVERKKTLGITISKKGYNIYTTSMIPSLAGAGVILGGLVDYGTGAVYDLQPNPLHVHLIPKKD
jgi:hypothetical protein